MNTAITKSAYAKHRGVRPSAVSNWITRQQIVLTPEGLVDVEKSDRKLGVTVDQAMGRPRSADVQPAADKVVPLSGGPRAGLIAEQTIEKRMANSRAAGELVSAAEAIRRTAEAARRVRERVHAAARGLAERLASERDPRAVRALLETELDRVFSEVADDLQRDEPAEAAA